MTVPFTTVPTLADAQAVVAAAYAYAAAMRDLGSPGGVSGHYAAQLVAALDAAGGQAVIAGVPAPVKREPVGQVRRIGRDVLLNLDYPPPCEHCGFWLWDHEWIDEDAKAVIVACSNKAL